MTRHPLSKTLSFAALLLTVLLSAFVLPAPVMSAPDSAMQQSLKSFFNNGVAVSGATAQLIEVENWPKASGALNWSLPHRVHGHPKRLALIAKQGKKRWYVPVRLHWWATAIVMKKAVPARSLLTQDMITKTRSDIAGHSGHWWEDTSSLLGMRLTRPLAKGAVILASHVKQPPLIKRGEIVQIILEVGRLHLRAEGKAMRSAGKGERLPVRNIRSKEIIQATAVNKGTVRVHIHGGRG